MVKNPPVNAGNLALVPTLGRAPRVGDGNSHHYSCLGNPVDRGAWWPTVYGVARVGHDLAPKQQQQSQVRLSVFILL